MNATIADVNGATLSYVDIGLGVPLLCLHGGLGIDARSLLVSGIVGLVDRGIRLIVPDQRGHGRSSRGGDAQPPHARGRRAARAGAPRLRLGRPGVVGDAWAGFRALQGALRWPEPVTDRELKRKSTRLGASPRT